MKPSAPRLTVVILVATMMVGMGLVVFSSPLSSAFAPSIVSHSSGAAPARAGVVSSAPASKASVSAPVVQPAIPSVCSSLVNVNNNPDYAAFVQHVSSIAEGATAAGLPASAVHLPYTGPYADQSVNGVPTGGSQLSAECDQDLQATAQTEPTGVDYAGAIDNATGVHDITLDSNSVAGILTVNSQTQNFYPGSGTPTQWGGQENVVLPNVTIFGSRCPSATCSASGSGNYAFWVQNVISYDSNNDTISFVDDTWNFTSGAASMFSSSLASWSPNGGNYTGVWVAFSPYFHVAPPFTVTTYVNTSVNAAGDQVLWYNYSIDSAGLTVQNGNYDYLVFNSQPLSGGPIALNPPDFEASAHIRHEVTEGYEFDAFIGADDGANNLMLGANATMQVEYCVQVPYCNGTSFSYASVPGAVNYGMQTGEQTVGIAVNYVGTTAYLTGGPLITHGLWNYTGQVGDNPGSVPVTNAITVSGDPEGALTTQPYVFVFFESTNYTSQGYQWAPDVPTWYLMPGTYNYEVMLADYTQQNGTLVVGSSATTLTAVLPYNSLMGVYTPLWAFGNGQLAGISTSGDGTLADQYVPFNNPTTGYFGFTPNNLSANFYSADDYSFASFTGVLFDGTSAYVDLNAPPTFAVTHTARSTTHTYYLGFEFFETSNVTLAHAAAIHGWPSWEEIAFYIDVPASQNPAPQAEVFVWNSTHDLIMSNTFVATLPTSGSFVSPDELVLYGGTDNVVWGNTFRDPYGSSLGSTYAGLGLGESGDLIYNNNFSVDNPVVYLPYNWANVADCLPQYLGGCAYNTPGNGWFYNTVANVIGNTWNITSQSASNVAETVNGFALSGNVLGPGVTTQGGNYFWNYGTSPNNYSTNPYVSRFYYSDWSNIFPLGCGSIQAPGAPCGTAPPVVGAYENGIQVGGDYAPYGPTVAFSETGLPTGTGWSVTINANTYSEVTSSVVLSEPYGTYAYTVTAPSGFTVLPTSGSLLVSGARSVNLVFTPWATGGNAISVLYNVYNGRSDLQSEFPQVATNLTNFTELVDWAGSVVTGATSDPANSTLSPYGYWYDLMMVYDHRGDLQYAFVNAYTDLTNYTAFVNWAGGAVTGAFTDSAAATLSPFGYYYTLRMVYDGRADLQAAFPNAYTNPAEYSLLVNWAGGVVTGSFVDSDLSTLNHYGYYYALMVTYNGRGDLQAAFPSAFTNGVSYHNLLVWAKNVVTHKFPDSSYATLLPFAAEYEALG
jgi:hypothetical protein